MPKKFSPAQLSKIKAGKRYLKISTEPDRLYQVVVIIGPTVFGYILHSNSDTVWSRVESPGYFKMIEIDKLCEVLDLTVVEFFDMLHDQIGHNKKEKENNRPIGRERYNEKLF